MTIENKSLDSINEEDLKLLIENKEQEGKKIEYKAKILANADSEKKEFLYDVSSFANASGGDLIYGMETELGIPTKLSGMTISDLDSEILRLDSIIISGIEPRIPGFTIHPIRLKSQNYVIIIRIPRSWALPHMVKFKNSSKFYSRRSAGKYQLDVSEIGSSCSIFLTSNLIEGSDIVKEIM